MSGGYFEYQQYRIKEIIEKMEDDLKSNFIEEEGHDMLGGANPNEREHCIYHIQQLVEDLTQCYERIDALDLFLCGDTDAEDFLKACKDD